MLHFVASKLSHRINRKDARTRTIKAFLERETGKQNAKMFENFMKAWDSILILIIVYFQFLLQI